MLDDDEIADRILEAQQDAKDPGFGLADWTYERELLVGITETLMSLRAVLIGVNSKNGKVPKVPTLPRPVTAVQRAESRRSKERLSGLMAQIVPHDN